MGVPVKRPQSLGPGAGHEYLAPLADLWKPYGIPTVLYDQIGCGQSTHFRDKIYDNEFWSWGGVLGAEYAKRQPKGLKKLVIASGPADISLYIEGLRGLLQKLPADIRKTFVDCNAAGDHESEEFQKAAMVFGRNFVSQLDPLPEEVQVGYKNLKDDPTVYVNIQGPAEFVIVGSIKGYQGWKEAHKIEVETLLVNGKNDEVTNLAMYPWFKTIPKVRWVTLNGAHHSHWEDRERYM